MTVHRRLRWLFRLAFRARMHRQAASLLVIASLALASSMVVSADLVTRAAYGSISRDLSRFGSNLVIHPRSREIALRRSEPFQTQPERRGSLRASKVMSALRETDLASAAFPSLEIPLSIEADGQTAVTEDHSRTRITVRAVNLDALPSWRGWWHIDGAWPKSGEAAIGRLLSAKLGLSAGDELVLAGSALRLSLSISAVIESGEESDQMLFAELSAVRRASGLTDALTRVEVAVPPARLDKLRTRLAKLLPEARIVPALQVVSNRRRFAPLVLRLLLIAGAGILVAAFISVLTAFGLEHLDRIGEVASLKALGATTIHLVALFAIETGLLAAAGGIPGVLLGYAVAAAARSGTGVAIQPTMESLLFGIFASAAVAAIGSAGPLRSLLRAQDGRRHAR